MYYPFPGGCGPHITDGFGSATITTDIMQLAKEQDKVSNVTFDALSYWTSVIKFIPAGLMNAETGNYYCPTDKSNVTTIYRVFSAPLVTAGGGGSFCSYTNPGPQEAASVLKTMSSTQDSLGILVHSFRPRISNTTKVTDYQFTVARRPGTAYVVTIVVEYQSASTSARVAYAPVILYGCQNRVPQKSFRGYSFVVKNSSTQLGCGVLPTNAPSIYFPVAMLLLGSIFYACSCNFLVWLRCGVSVMATASLLGVLFFYRYSVLTSNTVLLLVVSIFVPGVLALIVFTVLWCVCIRPTLYYQQIFGRGPLMRVLRSEEQPMRAAEREPWNTEFFHRPQSSSGYASQSSAFFVTNNELTAVPSFNPLPTVSEEVSSPGPYELRGTPPNHLAFEMADREADEDADDELQDTFELRRSSFRCGDGLCLCTRSCYCPPMNTPGRSTRILSLKPRRLARLPPILPATFLLVACLSIALETVLSLKSSVASYVAFVTLISLLMIGILCVFKNLAFGLSTALVGVYLCLSCICMFLIPNALLPHIVIEQFLRLTWIEHRLDTVRIEFYGLYDILILVSWIFGTLIFGLLTLCLIRLQDARELAEAQRARPFSLRPCSEGQSLTVLPTTSGSAFWNEVANLSNASWFLPGRTTPAMGSVPLSSAVNENVATPMGNSLSQFSCEAPEVPGAGLMESTNLGSRVPTERTQLLPGFHRVSYGGLASTTQQPLMPLSRVQLAAANTGRLPGSSSRLFGSPQSRSGPSEEVEDNKEMIQSFVSDF
ncbi:hypothetical protein D915_007828 [Fasciola hepatica]|uniref:Uncharacterized protein n=1 Tax=Fasciola hepatica TaxID=6192 RepID=A0A4E0RJC9_FASHE|nr:hypothetical protein D915_007828 [Fasciola hepatica]